VKAVKWLERYFEEAICVILLISMTIAMMLQIVMRYFFKAPMTWPEEFCRYCFIASAFISLGYCFRNNCMLRIDMFAKKMPKVIGTVLEFFSRIASVAFCLIMVKPAYQVAVNAAVIDQVSPAMKLPMWILYGMAPLGFALGVIRGIQDFFTYIRTLREAKEVEAG